MRERLHAAPFAGPAALLFVSLWRVLAHNIVVLEHRWLAGPGPLAFGAACGAFGILLVWRGRQHDELAASLHGFAGGALLWMGWFEHGFEYFAGLMQLQPLIWNGVYALPPNLVLMQGSVVILLALLLLFGMNRDTGCRMFLWVRRRLHLDAGAPTPGLRKSFARIAALEYVMVSWFMYAVILLLLDPRLLGPRHPATAVVAVALLAWAGYLALWRAPRLAQMAGALRWAIGAGGIIWLVVELAAQLRWVEEVWVRPEAAPLANAGFWVAFALLGWLIWRAPTRGGVIKP